MARLFRAYQARAAEMPGLVAASQRLNTTQRTAPVGVPWAAEANMLPQQAYAADNPWEDQQPLEPAMNAWASSADVQQARVNASQRLVLSGSVWRDFQHYPDRSSSPVQYMAGVEPESEPWYKSPVVLSAAVLGALGTGFWLLSR